MKSARKVRSASRKRIIIASILAAILVVGAIISIVLVLAATAQNVATNVKIGYYAEGVGAKASATYAIVPTDTSASIVRTSMKNGGSEYVEFFVEDEESTGQIVPEGEITLDPHNKKVVFEYMFENTGDVAFSIQMTESFEKTNVETKYLVSGTRLSLAEYRSKIVNESLAPQAVTSFGDKIYIYVALEIVDANRKAGYEGDVVWMLMNQETIDITLNDEGFERTLPIIPNSELEGIAMPVINDFPTRENCAFNGYYTAEDGAGTAYINYLGAGVHTADLAEGATLYAYFNETFIVNGTTLVGLTDAGKELNSVEVSDNITEIGANAFAGSQATSVTIPNTVTTIGESAFANNSNLQEVNIETVAQTAAYADGTGLATIGRRAFHNCTGIKELVIPSTVTSIANGALAGCDNLRKLEFPYVYTMNFDDDYRIDGTLLSGSPFAATFTKMFLSADSESYADDELQEYVPTFTVNDIPSGLREVVINAGTIIDDMAFYECSMIKSITIPASVTTIHLTENSSDSIPFFGCTFLRVKNLSGQTLHYADISKAEVLTTDTEFVSEFIEDSKYEYFVYQSNKYLINTKNKNITTLNDIPSDVNIIYRRAFANCSRLSSVVIPSTITQIYNGAFMNCSSLRKFELSASLLNADRIFDNYEGIYASSAFAKIFFRGNSETDVVYGDDVSPFSNGHIPSSLTEVVINGGTSLCEYAFYGCSNLQSITISPTITQMKTNAFQGCAGLNRVNISDLAAWCNISYGNYLATPLYIANNLYLNGTLLEHLTIPASVSIVKYNAFLGARCLKSITIPSTVTTIASQAFTACSGVTSLSIANSVTTIQTGAFSSCSSLTSVTIPSSVKSIYTKVFENCTSLSSVTFAQPNYWYTGSSATTAVADGTYIDVSNSSTNAANLKSGSWYNKYLLWTETAPPTPFVFGTYEYEDEDLNLTTVKSITGLTASGQSATELVIPNDVVVIDSNALSGNSNLLTISYEENSSLKLIADGAFASNTSLTTVRLPSTVENIGLGIVSGCNNLQTLEFPYVFSYDATHLFDGSVPSSLQTVIINGGDTIYQSAFNGTSITNLTVGDSITMINVTAFYMCDALETVVIGNGVETISGAVFADCNNLRTVVIGTGITRLGGGVFSGCANLQSVEIQSTKTNWICYSGGYSIDITNPTNNAAQLIDDSVIEGSWISGINCKGDHEPGMGSGD